jgi:hypothetical protein
MGLIKQLPALSEICKQDEGNKCNSRQPKILKDHSPKEPPFKPRLSQSDQNIKYCRQKQSKNRRRTRPKPQKQSNLNQTKSQRQNPENLGERISVKSVNPNRLQNKKKRIEKNQKQSYENVDMERKYYV